MSKWDKYEDKWAKYAEGEAAPPESTGPSGMVRGLDAKKRLAGAVGGGLSLIPPTATILGGMAGAPAGVPGIATGGALGAVGGRNLENFLRQMVGMQPVQGLVASSYERGGFPMRPELAELASNLEAAAGGGFTGFGSLAGPGRAARAAQGFKTRMADRAAGRAVADVERLQGVRDVPTDPALASQASVAKNRALQSARTPPPSPEDAAGEAVDVSRRLESFRNPPKNPGAAAADAIDRSRAMEGARRSVVPEVEQAVGRAEAAREAAGQRMQAVTEAAQAADPAGRVTLKDLVDGVKAWQMEEFGRVADDQTVQALVKKRLREVLPKVTGGAIPGRTVAFDYRTTAKLASIWRKLSKGDYSQMGKGFYPNPDADIMVESALRRGLDRVSGFREASAAYREAAEKHTELLRLAGTFGSDEAAGLSQAASERAAATGARISAEAGAASRRARTGQAERLAGERARIGAARGQRKFSEKADEAERLAAKKGEMSAQEQAGSRIASNAEERRIAAEQARMAFDKPLGVPISVGLQGVHVQPQGMGPGLIGANARLWNNPNTQAVGRVSPALINYLMSLAMANATPQQSPFGTRPGGQP